MHKNSEVIVMAWWGFGRGRGRGYRWMYWATGLPGWMRFGYSPGWLGVSPTGLPPTAQWIIQSGQLPNFMAYLQTQNPYLGSTQALGTPTMPMAPLNEKQILEQQLQLLQQQLDVINKRLKELEKS